MGYLKGEDRNQLILFLESIDEYVSGNNSIRILDEYIEQLDLERLSFNRAVNPN
jgi:transposase